MMVVIPESLRIAIDAAINNALAGRPCDDETREYLFQCILSHYDEFGKIPQFTIEANHEQAKEETEDRQTTN
jgi:hypothetical protein